MTQRRLAALRQYSIMDSPPEKAFDDLAELASYICGTPIAIITLLDAERQWFKARVGLDAIETPIGDAFCAHAIQMNEVMVVEDARKDDRFAVNPYVTGNPNIRFYAGAPLITPEGVPVGTICAIDCVPRRLPEEQRNALSILARQVVTQMELRRTIASLETSMKEMAEARKEIEQLKQFGACTPPAKSP
jgi:GAF domain-containing protein